MAFNPKGVAAFPRPNMLATRFIMIAPVAGLILGMLGNKKLIMGFTKEAIY